MKSAVFKTALSPPEAVDFKRRILRHRITREVPDRYGDIIRIDGIDTTDFRRKPAVLYGHDYIHMDPVPVIGKNVGFEKVGDSLYARTEFLDSATLSPKLGGLVSDLWQLNLQGLLGWSLGLMPIESQDIVGPGRRVAGIDYTKTILLEYSNVIIPAHQDAVNDAIRKGLVQKEVRTILSLNEDGESLLEGGVWYARLVDWSRVSKDEVRAAEDMLHWAGGKLKIREARVAWYEFCEPNAAGARVFGEKKSRAFVTTRPDPIIYLRVGQGVWNAQFAAAHELHHVWLMRDKRYSAAEKEALYERSAEAFAWLAVSELKKKQIDERENAWVRAHNAVNPRPV